MSTEENKARARRFIEEVWNGGHLAVIDELVSSAYVDHDPNNPITTEEGLEGAKQSVTTWRSAFLDVQGLSEQRSHRQQEGSIRNDNRRQQGAHSPGV